MTCSSVQITLNLGNSCCKTHTVIINNNEKSYDRFISLVSRIFSISTSILKLAYFEQETGCEKLLDSTSFPQIYSHSQTRIKDLNIVGVHFEILETVEDFCCAVTKLNELISRSSLLINAEFLDNNEAEDLDEIILKYCKMVETGLHPWQSVYCDNNREYFYSQNVSSNFLFTAKALRLSHLTWKNTSSDKVRKIKMLRFLTLNLMWNFLAKKEDREHWYTCGAIQFAIDTFFDADSLPDAYDLLQELSIGVLVQFTEMESAKSHLIRSERFMNKFCELMADTRCLSSHNEELIYSGQLRLNTLMCLLSSPAAHKLFLERNIVSILTEIAPYVVNNVASYYFFCLCVAFLFGFSLDLVTSTSTAHSKCDEKIKANRLCEFQYLSSMVFGFWQRFSPADQYSFEVEKQYIWITMKPYVELAWCNSQPPCQDLSNTSCFMPYRKTTFQQEKMSFPKLMGVWALDSMTRNKENSKIIYDEGLKDFVTMLCWDLPEFMLRKAVECVCEGPHLCANYITETLPQPPSLQNICRGNLIKHGKLTPQTGINASVSEIIEQLISSCSDT